VTLSDGVKVTRSERWLYPCAGSATAEIIDDDVIMLSEADETKTRRNVSMDWNGTLKTLAEKSVELRKRVAAVKQLYVRQDYFLAVVGLSSITASVIVHHKCRDAVV